VGDSGPARRQYVLTPRGEEHLEEWIAVLDHISASMSRLVREARSRTGRAESAKGNHSHRRTLRKAEGLRTGQRPHPKTQWRKAFARPGRV
jgi:DNA-binding PadR family transcriptional regulator